MATQTEEIILRLGMDSASAVAGLKSFGDTAKNFAHGLLGAFSAGVVIEQISKVIEKFDDLKNKAENLSVGTDFLQGMEQIARKDSPGGIKAFDKSIAELSVKLGQAKEGSKQATADFTKLGISLQQISDLNTEQMFYVIADAIAAMDDPAKRAAAAFELMGRSGKDIIGILSKGSGEIKEGISKTTKLDENSIKALGEYKETMEDLGNAADVTKAKLVVGFAKMPAVLKEIFGGAGAAWERSRARVAGSGEANIARIEAENAAKLAKEDQESKDRGAEKAMKAADYAARAAEGKLEMEKQATAELEKQTHLSRQLHNLYKQAENIKRRGNRIDQESVTIGDLAGHNFTNKLNQLYGAGGRFDLGAGDGPFARIAQEYLLKQKQQQWDIIHGNAEFDKDGNLIGGQAYADQMEQRRLHNLLAGAGIETPEQQFADMRDDLSSIQEDIGTLLTKASDEGIKINVE